ncbi:hypothetical protein AB0L63_21625 [Nocardia sp. NPDC051990]|uniref:hypothetical protein n=1 Tax=Nocardia sp. NPDC051990 TaxID=3155285 RepID=UPI0034473099
MKHAIRHLQVDYGAAVDGIYGPETRAKAIQWPVFRVADEAFGNRFAPAPWHAVPCRRPRCMRARAAGPLAFGYTPRR